MWPFEWLAVEVLDYWCDLNSSIGYSLTEDGLVSLISDKRGALVIKDQASQLTTR